MARMESQQKHTRDNMRVLATIENDDNYRKLMYNKVIEILSQVDTMSIDLAEQLEAETAVIPTRRENGYIVIPPVAGIRQRTMPTRRSSAVDFRTQESTRP